MLAVSLETTPWSRPRGAPRAPEPPKAPPAAPIDLDRVVWDKEYRDEVRLHLKAAGPEA